MENNKRLFWIDNLKGLMILLVVISHCLFLSYYDPQTKYVCDTYHYFFLSFFSYVFFGVSGYLFELRKKGNASVYSMIRREIQLIFPTMIISVVDVLLFSGCKLNSFPYTDRNVLFNVVRFSSLKEFIMLVIWVAYSYWFMWIIADDSCNIRTTFL